VAPRLSLSPTSSGRRRRRLGAGLALAVALAVVIGIVSSGGSTSTPAGSRGSGTTPGAAVVQRRDLVQTDTESGTLSYSDPQTVYNRLNGTITWLPSVGQEIKPGQALYKVGGEPVILMDGTTPAYRDLTPSDSAGADVLQLNRNLVALGFNPSGITIDDTWQAATTAAVGVFQESLGETPTGSLSLGQVVFLPGDQLISTVDATLGSTGGSSGSSASASTPVVALAPEFVGYQRPATCSTTSPTTTTTTSPTTTTTSTRPQTTTTTTATTSTTTASPCPRRSPTPSRSVSEQTLAALIALLRAETAQLRAQRSSSASGRGGSSGGAGSSSNSGTGSSANSRAGSSANASAASGSSGAGASSSSGGSGSVSAILQTTSNRLVVTVALDATKQSEAVVGELVTVELPDGSTVNGKVTAVSPVAQSQSGSNSGTGSGAGGGGGSASGSSSTIPVTISLSGHHAGAGLDQAAVSVNFAQARANNVLSVPVTALLATAGGGYAVQSLAAPHKLLPVTTGLFAAGYVEISGPGIFPGLQVSDAQG